MPFRLSTFRTVAVLQDLRPEFTKTVGIAIVITWIAASAASLRLLHMSLPQAVLGGLLICPLHWLAVFIHHFGHALAARSVESPMSGVRLWGWLGTSLYPGDEANLPASTHIRRALGSPIASTAFGLIAAALAWAILPEGESLWIATVFLGLDNLGIFSLGSLIPLGFNDGSTLLKWLPKRD